MIKNIRDLKSASEKRQYLEKTLGISLKNISFFSFSEEDVLGRNIESLIGTTQIPLGIAGPLTLRTTNHQLQTTYIPLATTEGALVASVSRGCKAISESGGANVAVENVGITRGPVFKTDGITHSLEVKKWIDKNFTKLAKACEKTSSHIKLKKIGTRMAGKNLYARFYFDSSDAMGMNMATIATEEAVKLIEQETRAKCISVAGNFDIDKKGAWLNFISGRGKRVWAEVILPKKVVKDVLKVTCEEISEVVYRKCLIGSIMAGSLGFNAHFANIIAAIFAATGQDLGQVVEGSLGITTAEVLDSGDLYFSVYLPALLVGTIGGGTGLPTQKEAFSIMGIKGSSDVLKFADIVGAAVLAGELSLISSQAEGTLGKTHIKLGRKGK